MKIIDILPNRGCCKAFCAGWRTLDAGIIDYCVTRGTRKTSVVRLTINAIWGTVVVCIIDEGGTIIINKNLRKKIYFRTKK